MDEITWLGYGHSSDTKGTTFPSDSVSKFHKSTGGGWDPDTCEHTLPICLVAKEICIGLRPLSSNNISVFLFGCNHDCGTWYLPD